MIVETDGFASHGGRDAFERDRTRDIDRTAQGWAVLRITQRQLGTRPAWVAARLAQTLGRSA